MLLCCRKNSFPSRIAITFRFSFKLIPAGHWKTLAVKLLAARELIIKHPEVKNVHWFVGTNAPNFFYNMGGGNNGNPNYAQGLVQLHDSRNVNDFIINLQRELDVAFP